MSTKLMELDELLDSAPMGGFDSSNIDGDGTEQSSNPPFQEPGYEGNIDYRIRQLSYSSLLTLHTCPRKFQLNRLRTTHRTEEDARSTITFAFGHVVGQAIQSAFTLRTREELIWEAFLGWHTDLLATDAKGGKSFWECVVAIDKFLSLREQGFLDEYELVYYNGRPACELSFCINLPNGFRLRGFVDAVLRHRTTGKIIVLECKTTGMSVVNPATFKNSAQAIGYSIVLDHIFPELSSYEVLYLIYQTKAREFHSIPFTKTYLQRALWITELLLDIETIELYDRSRVYPMRGESCLNFGRECEYFQTCTLNTGYLTKPCSPEEEDRTEYQVSIGLEDLLSTQLEKTNG